MLNTLENINPSKDMDMHQMQKIYRDVCTDYKHTTKQQIDERVKA